MGKTKTADEKKVKLIAAKALTFITELSSDSRYGDFSSIVHYVGVANTATKISGFVDKDSLAVITAASYLHDFFEDFDPNAFHDIKVKFGAHVANLAWAVSGFGRNRIERLQNKFTKIPYAPVAFLILIADRIENFKMSVETGDANKIAMYCEEHNAFVSLSNELLEKACFTENVGSSNYSITVLNQGTLNIDFARDWLKAYTDFATPVVEARLKRKAREAKKASKK